MKTAVLGLGFMGSTHLQAMQQIPGAELAAVWDADPQRLTGDLSAIQGNLNTGGGRFDFSAVTAYTDLSGLLADPAIEAVDICLPTYLHEDVAIRALQAGKHVLVEKPMALDGAGGRRMIEAADRAGRLLMCAQVLRFFPEYVVLKEAMGRLGRPRAAYLARRCAEPGWGGWLKDAARSGGGAFDLLIHDIDQCLYLFGKPHAVSASGFANWVSGHLYYEGLTVTVEGGWQDSPRYPFTMEYRVTLEHGTVEFSSAGRPPVEYTAEERVLPLPSMGGYAAEIAYFVECCTTGRRPERCLPEDSAAAVDLTHALLNARERKGEKCPC
jgi:predicted dehydrogenase